jgi:hypothetical protein
VPFGITLVDGVGYRENEQGLDEEPTFHVNLRPSPPTVSWRTTRLP